MMFRSSDRAIGSGRTAVETGALAEDGAVAAIVVNSFRQAVWACSFNDSTRAPEEVTLPEDLRTVPRADEDGHSDWLHRRTRHGARVSAAPDCAPA